VDFLSHLFVPLTAAYVLRRDLFASAWAVALAGFGLLADVDKFLGTPACSTRSSRWCRSAWRSFSLSGSSVATSMSRRWSSR